MISFRLAPALGDYERRCREQIAELRRDNGLCERCGESPHVDGCRYALSYLDRKQIGRCTYPGCPEACVDGVSVECDEHHDRTVARQRKRRENTGRVMRIVGGREAWRRSTTIRTRSTTAA